MVQVQRVQRVMRGPLLHLQRLVKNAQRERTLQQ